MKDRVDEIAGNCGYDGDQGALANMVYKFIDKKTGSEMIVNALLAEKFNKAVIKNFKRWKVYGRFKDNIWATDLAEMESFS